MSGKSEVSDLFNVVIRTHTMNWNDHLKLIVNRYRDKPDDYVISLGHWQKEDSLIEGVQLPAFNAFIRMTVGELKKMEAAL